MNKLPWRSQVVEDTATRGWSHLQIVDADGEVIMSRNINTCPKKELQTLEYILECANKGAK